MFFKKKTCDKCFNEYDELLDHCPYCQNENDSNKEFKKKIHTVFIPYLYELLAFIMGFGIFNLLSTLFAIIFSNIYNQDNIKGLMLINMASYLVIFALFGVLVYKYFKYIFKDFNKLSPYIIGIIGGIVLIGLSYLLTYLGNLIHEGTGGNQGVAEALTLRYPVMAIFILGMIGPIVEELTYRLGLFSFFSRINRIFAYIMTGLIFGLIHFDFTSSDLILELVNLPQYVLAGLLLSHIYERGGLIASSITHIINNVTAIIMILIIK